MNKALFFFSSSSGMGLTSHFSRQIVDMYNYGIIHGWDTYCVSTQNEQNAGLWDYVETNIPSGYIIKIPNNTSASTAIKEKILGYELSIIHVQGFSQLKEIIPLLNKSIRCVITIHSYPNKPFLKKFVKGSAYYWMAKKYADKMIFVSPFALRGFLGGGKLSKMGKIVHIPFCLPYDDCAIESSYIKDNCFNIVYLANFLKNKGHERYFESIKRFSIEHQDVHFWFFGDGPRKSVFQDMIKKAGLEEQIHCPGRVDRKDVPGILKKSQLAMILSKKETAGHAFLEPIMNGCPVIGTRVGFAEYLIQDYITSLGIDNVDDLYKALKFAYTHYCEMKKMAKRMQSITSETFKYEAMIEAYYRIYEDITEQ